MKNRGLARHSLVTLLLLFVFTAGNISAKARVFLLGGQSNMAGAGLFAELKKSEQVPPEGVLIWHKNQWQKLGPGISANTGRFGPELAFGRAMRKAFPDDDIYLIKRASGGTSMHKHWTFANGGGPLLKRFLADARAALKDLDRKKVDYQVDAMLWMQGESDADQGKGAEYEASLKEFIKEIRREFKRRDLPFIMGRIITTFDKPKGNGPLVRAAQESLAKKLKNVACFDTDDFPRINKGHYNHEGQLILGKTFAKHFLKMVADEKK
ncbi:hypothetical protein JIN77_10875 [Verrucomicrobiaceae bacterium R5-34]|nr:hypothetical protein [Verrucomicrobiaceae bacterium R5-34]